MNVTTWNMQGSNAGTEVKWQTGVLTLTQLRDRWRPDIICLQECGGRPPSGEQLFDPLEFHSPGGVDALVHVYRWGGTRLRPAAWIAYYPWDTGGNRVNLAVLTREGPIDKGHVILAWPAGLSWRPVLGLRTASAVVFSCHAISPGGADAPGLLAAAQAAAGAVHWVVAGDFNREPNSLALPVGSAVYPPNGPTHPMREPTQRYDYAVGNVIPAAPGQVLDLKLSDHLPVAFML